MLRTTGEDNVLLATHNGMTICFNENDVRCMGRMAVGVRGIRLKPGDTVVGAAVADMEKCLLTITENGYGKRTPMEQYLRGDEVQSRGGYGKRGYHLTEKTGPVAGALMVDENDDILLIESGGVVIRTPVESVSKMGRDARGVIVMRIEPGKRVIAIQRTDPAEEEIPENSEAEESNSEASEE